MRLPRSATENDYVLKRVRGIVDRLQADPQLKLKFLQFAVANGVPDPGSFAMRLYTIVKLGRPPSAFTALLLTDFETKHPPKKKQR